MTERKGYSNMSTKAGDGNGSTKHTVHWFRKGLRLHDNPSLREGLKNSTTFRCVFIIDPWFAGSSNVGINKWRFLLQCLEDLDRSLRKLNSHLFVVRGQPADALPKLFKEWGTTELTFEEDPEPFGRVRDLNIMAMCKELGISVVSKASHTLYKLDNIIEKNGGKPPLTYHQFQTVIANMDPPPKPEESVTAKLLGSSHTPLSDDHDVKYGVPTLEELGFETEKLKPPVWYGGESEALARLERHLERKAWVASFGHPKMTPQSLLASQTGLSPYLRFGCLSTRLFYYQLTELYKKIKKAKPPLSLHGQLLWREFFYCAATKNPNFDKMQGNPICVQIPWDHNPQALAKWANGQTGFPWIDAIMTQLREEGWIHHLARHAVACFLTRGDLWISWEEGMKVFDELLLDADWSVNAGMWMWLSCSSFFQQFFHCYCPVRFGRKADPNGDYIRKYLPVLKNFPTKYIHEPWLAPEEEQRAAKCIIGKDFPLPMVNHSLVSRMNIERMKQVYRQLSKYRGQVGTIGGMRVRVSSEIGSFQAFEKCMLNIVNASSVAIVTYQSKPLQVAGEVAVPRKGVLATVARNVSTPIFGNNISDGHMNIQQEINVERKNKENTGEDMKMMSKEYGILSKSVINQNSPRDYYNNFANGNVIQGNSMVDGVYTPGNETMGQNQFSRYIVDSSSRNFQGYTQTMNLENFQGVSNQESLYLSPGLKNSPEGYVHNSEVRSVENNSNSMSAPFENMGIHSKSMEMPISMSQTRNFEGSSSPAFINLDSAAGNLNNYHYQSNGPLPNESNEKFINYKDDGGYTNQGLYGGGESEYGNQGENNNFVVETRRQMSIEEDKSNA